MKKTSVAIGAVIFFALVVGFDNCGNPVGFSRSAQLASDAGGVNAPLNSTISGNPFNPGGSATARVVTAVCNLVQKCYQGAGADFKACYAAVVDQPGADDEALGLPQNSYQTFQDVIDAEQTGQLFAANEDAGDCVSSIQKQSCSMAAGLYDSTLSDPYQNSASAITASCTGVFGNDPTDDPETDP